MVAHRQSFSARWRPLALLLVALATSVNTAPPRTVNALLDASDPYRLPRSVLPSQYTLVLEPNLDTETFSGNVVIQVEADDAVDNIKLHSLDLDLEEVNVAQILGDGLTSAVNLVDNLNVTTLKEYQMVAINLKENLQPSTQYEISIKYNGNLKKDMYGFYVSTYKIGDSEKKLAATQFQATHARKAFPCFDEPNFKARFKIKIIVDPQYQCLSNMPVEHIEKNLDETDDNRHQYVFGNSISMSPYLVAFVVSEFVGREDVQNNWYPDEANLTTWVRPNAIYSTEYSLEVTRPMLNVMEHYTNISYIDNEQTPKLDKIDQVALPDFSAGAMENWGLITYRETALLFNDGSADAQKRVATVIAHELLHMWFGNLITTYWWDTTWLNEGFARYFQYYITAEVETDWRMWDQFVVDQHQMVFALDSLATAQALTHAVSTPAQASSSFGTITYSKGGSVLRMISYTIGEENFQNALQSYLEKHKYKNVRPKDLFDELKIYASEASLSEDSFQDFLESWTEQAGFPIVEVTRNYETNVATLSQKRFLFKGSSPEQYIIPITWTEEEGSFNPYKPELFVYKDTVLDIKDMPDADKWVIFNLQETGYYRVNYDVSNWNMISTYLNDRSNSLDNIHLLNRAQLLDDAFNLARASELSYEIALDLADYLARETDYIPWAAALTAFSYLDRMLVNHEKYPVFQRYVLRLMERSYGLRERDFYLNSAPESHEEKLMMNRLATWACKLGHTTCIDHSIRVLRNYLGGGIPSVNADQRSVTYCYGLSVEFLNYWDRMWTQYTISDDDVERGLIVAGLACSSSENRLRQLLQYSIEGTDIRKQDASSVFSAVYANPLGVDVALEFLDTHFQDVLDYYGSMGSINSIVTGIAGRLTTEEQRTKLEAFVTKYSDHLETSGDAALLTVDDNLSWLNDHASKIIEILERKDLEQYRLPNWVKPTHYEIFLNPDLQLKIFFGNVLIDITAQEATETIILHAEGIQTTKLSVRDVSSNQELLQSHSYDETHEFLKLHLSKPLTPNGQYVIDIAFNGRLRDNMYGFYYSTYIDGNGNEVPLAATQFQPTHARKAFPCFDEPSFKANFTLTITTPENYHALGNMPAVNTGSPIGGVTNVTFVRTPVMSTYLIAFVVADFDNKEDQGPEVVFRTWARSNALQWAEYSMEISRDLLEALEDYTDIKYKDSALANPFDKVDQVALPDFSAGAMENWGLITYRETALLYNNGTASARKSVATIIAHELTHMWFGNLVTTHWWDATWLNEGFAQLFQFFASSQVLPDWRLMDQFLVDHHQGSFASDSLTTSAALTSPAYTPAQVSARFGTITYSKGASVLRMISSVIGEDNFKDVLHSYLYENRYSTTVPDDLFDHFVQKSSAANLASTEFRKLLYSWTEQPGFPVVKVQRNYNRREATVSQSRFLLKSPESPDTKLYYIPLTWTTAEDGFSIRTPQAYLTQEQTSRVFAGMPEEEDWVIFNVQEYGYYRVNYDLTNWKLLSAHLKSESNSLDDIHYLNRAQLLDDAFNLARAGQLDYEIAFDLSGYLRRETDYIPWVPALSAFSYLQRMLINNVRYSGFQNYVLHLLEEQYAFFNFEDRDTHIEKLFLNRVSAWACSLRHSHCTNSARDALHSYLDDGTIVPADLRSIAYCYGIRHTTNDYWHKLLEEYKESLDNAERALIMAGLACSEDEDILKELLGHSISGEFIRKQDASSVFSSVYGNSKGIEVALNFLDDNFDEVKEYYGSMGSINNIVVGIAGRLTTTNQRQKMEEFVNKYQEDLGTTAKAALELIDENILWLVNHEETILNILAEYENPVTEPPTTTTPDPEPSTPDPEPSTPDPEPSTPDPEPSTPNPEPSTPEPETTTPEPEITTPVTETTTAGSEGMATTVLSVIFVVVAGRIL